MATQYYDMNHNPVSYQTNNWGEQVLATDASGGQYTSSYGNIKYYDPSGSYLGYRSEIPTTATKINNATVAPTLAGPTAASASAPGSGVTADGTIIHESNPVASGQTTTAPTQQTTQQPTQTVTQTAAPTSSYTGTSIVDYLNSVGQASDYASRAKLAASLGIQGYTGTAAQNTQMLNTLRTRTAATAPTGTTAGTPAGTTGGSTSALPTSSYTGASIVDYLNSIGRPSDYASRAQLAASMGITNYTGTAAQNTQLLNSLRTRTGAGTTTGTGGTTGTGTQTGTGGTTGTTAGASTSANDPYAGLDPVQKQVKMYTDAANAIGLGTIKSQFDKFTKDQMDLTNKMNDEIANVRANPWLSQGIADREVEKIGKKYEQRLDTLTHLLTLTDSLYQQGVAQVNRIVSGAQDDIQAANALAQKQYEAAQALAKDNQIVSINGRELLVNKSTGTVVADLGASKVASSSSSTTAPKTLAERQALAVSDFAQVFVQGARTADGTPIIDPNGFVTPVAWKQAIADAPAEGLSREDFIKAFGYLLYTDGSGMPDSSYGLTTSEKNLLQ